MALLLVSISLSAQIVLLDEDFNSLQSGVPAGWDNTEGTAVNSGQRWKLYPSGYSGQCLTFDSHDNPVGLTNVLKTPLISLPANDEMVVRFMFKNDRGGSFRLYVLSDDGQPYTAHPLDTSLMSTMWVERTYSLAEFKGHNVKLVWHSTSNKVHLDDPSHYLDEVIVEQVSTCKSPTGIAAINVSENSATLVWTTSSEAGALPTYYQVYVYDVTGNIVFSEDSVPSSSNSITVTGLQASSNYSVSMRGDCRSSNSNYSRFRTFNFSTLCPAISFPYVNDFNSDNSISQCMGHLNASINTDATYAFGLSGRSLRLDPSENDAAYIVFPLIDARADSFEIDFSIRSFSYGNTIHYQVGVVSNPINPMDDFYPLTQDSLTTPDWHSFRLNSSVTGMTDKPAAICIYVSSGSDYPVFIDDVNIHRLPSCIRPEKVIVTNEGITTATVDWEMSPASSYIIHAVSLTDSLTFTTTTHPFSLSGLTPNTEYNLYVTAVCTPSDLSERSIVVNFTTLCNARTDIPFVESFEDAQLTIPSCWTQGWLANSKDNVATTPFISTSYTHYTGQRAMQILQQPAGVISYLSSQAVSIPQANAYDVEIAIKRSDAFTMHSREGITIWANTVPGDTVGGTRLGYVARYNKGYPAESSPEWFTYSFPIPLSGNLFFTLVSESQNGEDIFFDDFRIKASPSCRRVENIHVGNYTSSSVSIAWDAKGSESRWAVKYTIKNNGVVVRTDSITTTTSNYSVQNLSSSTLYTIEGTVYALCGGSSVSEGKEFMLDCQTRCLPVSIPYYENFNSHQVDRLAVCWDNSLTTATNKYPHYFWGVADVGNRRLMRLQFDVNTSSNDYARVTSPSIVLPAGGNYTLSFNYYSTISTNYGGVGSYQPVLRGSIDNGATFFVIDSLDFNMTDWVEKEYTLDSLAGNTLILMFEAETNHFGYIYIDDIQFINTPSCKKIKTCEVTNILPNSARLSIVDASATKWQYSICAHGTDPEQGTHAVIEGSMSVVINNLLANNEYDVYVRRICAVGDTSEWCTSPATFKTSCNATYIPYIDEFESSPVGLVSNDCYMTETKGTGYLKILQGPNYNHTENGSRCVVSCGNLSATTEGYISGSHGVYTYVYLQADTNYEISMYARKANNSTFVADNSDYKLRYLYGQYYGEDVMTLISNFTISSSNWTRYVAYFTVAADGYYYIGFDVYNENNNANYYFYGDDFLVRKISCVPPTASLVSDITSNSATINITSNDSRWLVAVSSSPLDPSRYVYGDVYNDTISNPAAIIPNLQPNTTYYYTIRTICGASDVSEWMQPASFRTRCTPVEIPYLEEFESSASTHYCWSSFGNGFAALSTAKPYDGFTSYSLSNISIVSPRINVDSIEHYMVSGMAYATGVNQTLEIGVMTDPDDVSSFISTDEIILTPNQWTDFTSYLAPVALEDDDVRASKYISISAFGSAVVYLDNVLIDTINSCSKPSAIVAQNIQAFTADISWTPTGSESSWIIKAVPTVVGATIIDTVTAYPATISGLQASTTYRLYIAAICSPTETSYWTDGGYFTTQCAKLVPPTLEDFQLTDDGAVVNCWNPRYDDPHVWRVYDYNGERMIRLDVQRIPYTGVVPIETPMYSLPAGSICELKFDYAHNASCGDFKINIRRSNETNYTTLATITKSNGSSNTKPSDIRTIVLNLANYAGSDVQFQLWASPADMYGTGAIFVDNFIVREIKDCREVADIQLSNASFNGIDVLITDTFENTQWQYMVVQRNADTTNADKVIVDSKSFTINTLDATTAYDLYIRSYCSASSQSNWEKAQFRTTASSITFPYYCDFADSTENLNWIVENGLTGNNSFMIGSDPLARISGSASLYISNNGYSYGYDINSISASCAARIVDFDAKKYNVEFSWYCPGGQDNQFGGAFDYARAYLVPAASGIVLPQTGMYYSYYYPSNLIPLDNNVTMQVVEGWQTNNVTIDMTNRPGRYYLVFSWVNSNKNDAIQYPFAVDHLSISENTCNPVAFVEKKSDAGTSAVFRYIKGESSAVTEWIVSESNTIFDTVSYGVATNDTTFTVTNLSPATKYFLFVRNNCGSSYSAWASYSFISDCAPLTTFPYYENFESQEFPAPCWSITSVAMGSNGSQYRDGSWMRVSFTGHGLTGYFVEIGGFEGAEALLAMPKFHFEAGREYNLSFLMYKSMNASSTDNMTIYLSENPNSVSDAVYVGTELSYDKNITSDGAYLISYDLPSTVAGDYHIVFDGIYGTGALMFDSITVSQYPLCRNFTVTPTIEKKTSSTMLVSIPKGNKSYVQFAWAPYLSSGTTVHDTIGSVITSTGDALISDLMSNTTYNVYARGICSNGDTTAWTPASRATTYNDNCFIPDNLHIVGDLGSNNAVIAWGGAPDAVKYSYMLTSASDTLTGEVTSDTIYLNALQPQTAYIFSVRSICTDTTDFVSIQFTTTPILASVPYICGFEDNLENAQWVVNRSSQVTNLYIGGSQTTGVKSGSKAAYVSYNSNNYGQRLSAQASVTHGTINNVNFMYRTFYLEPGVYDLSYDWRCDAYLQASSDKYIAFGKAFIVPASVNLLPDNVVYVNNLPALATLVSPNRMEKQQDWTKEHHLVTINETGRYNLVFEWYSLTDLSTANTAHLGTFPLAVDNISMTAPQCTPLDGMYLSSVKCDTAVVELPFETSGDYFLSIVDEEDSISSTIPFVNTDKIAVPVSAMTKYYLFVRNICNAGNTSSWRRLTFTTPDSAAVLPYQCDFEVASENSHWHFTQAGQTNYFAINTYAKNGGTKGLYITKNGRQNEYNATRKSVSYAWRDLYLEAGYYQYSFDWKSVGSSQSAYARMMVIPQNVELTEGVLLTDVRYDRSPNYAVSLDGGSQMCAQSTWITQTDICNIPSDGSYRLVAVWYNYSDNSDCSECQPPLALDNITFKRATCLPLSLSSGSSDANSVTFNINNPNTGSLIEYTLSQQDSYTDVLLHDTVSDISSITVSDLVPSSTYIIYARALCDTSAGNNDISLWRKIVLRTSCSVINRFPYYEGFEYLPARSHTQSLPTICWDALNVDVTQTLYNYTYPYYSVYDAAEKKSYVHSGERSITTVSSSNDYLFLVLPEMDSINDLRMSLWYSNDGTDNESSAFTVGYLTDATNINSFVAIENLVKKTKHTRALVSFTSAPAHARMSIRYGGGTKDNRYGYLDDINVTRLVRGNTYSDTICYNTPYNLHGFSVPVKDLVVGLNHVDYIRDAQVAGENDTLISADVYVYPEIRTDIYDSICLGYPYSGHGFNIPLPETRCYTNTMTNAYGCDSLVNLYLTITGLPTVTIDTICHGGSYVYGDTIITDPGKYTRSVTTPSGCNTTDTLYLMVLPDTIVETAEICNGDYYTFHGQRYNQAGTYYVQIVGPRGCSQTAVLYLDVTASTAERYDTICSGGSYVFGAQTLTQAGTYTRIYFDEKNCEITETLYLAVNAPVEAIEYDYACEGRPYSGHGFSGLTITKDTILDYSSKTAELCDSITHLHITYVPTARTDTFVAIAEGETFTWHDETYSRSGSYSVTLYSDETGCDSIVTLNLKVGVGVDNLSTFDVTIYPNPADNGNEVYVSVDYEDAVTSVELLNSTGALILTQPDTSSPINTASLPSGIYFIRISTSNGATTTRKLVVR